MFSEGSVGVHISRIPNTGNKLVYPIRTSELIPSYGVALPFIMCCQYGNLWIFINLRITRCPITTWAANVVGNNVIGIWRARRVRGIGFSKWLDFHAVQRNGITKVTQISSNKLSSCKQQLTTTWNLLIYGIFWYSSSTLTCKQYTQRGYIFVIQY